MESGIIILIAVVVAVVLSFVIAPLWRLDRPGRHKGAYIPVKDRPLSRDATNHSAISDAVGPRSRRFPDLER